MMRVLRNETHASPFLLALLLLLFLGYTGFAISLWPNIIPPDISTNWVASGPRESIGFTRSGSSAAVVASLRTTARRDGDTYVVSGETTFITSGMRADHITTASGRE